MKTNSNYNTISTLLLGFVLFLLSHSITQAQGWRGLYPANNTSSLESTNSVVTNTLDGGYLFARQASVGGRKMNLTKVDQDGTLQWDKVYSSLNITDPNFSEILQNPDGSFVISGAETNNYGLFIVKLDQNGNLIWIQNSFNIFYYYILGANHMAKAINGYILANNANEFDLEIRKIDENGTIVWTTNLSPGPRRYVKVITKPDNTYNVYTDSELYNIDSLGNVLSTKNISLSTGGFIGASLDIEPTPDGGILVTDQTDPFTTKYNLEVTKRNANGGIEWGSTYDLFTANSEIAKPAVNAVDGGYILTVSGSDTAVVLKVDNVGNMLWYKTFPGEFRDIRVTKDSSYILSGFDSNSIPRLIKLDKNGFLFDNFLVGTVFNDSNLNCFPDLNEIKLDNWLVEVTGDKTLYTFTNALGNYKIDVDSGSYIVNVTNPSPLWQSCVGATPVQVSSNDIVGTNFPMYPLTNCQYLTIDLSVPFLRRCFDNNYQVSFCNKGTVASANNVVDIDFHPHYDVISSSIPWSSQTGTTYSFPVGNLDINECGNFSVTVVPNCDSTILGQALCAYATIKPDTICGAINPAWDGSITDLKVHCGPDSLTFTITNTGTGNMGTPQDYLVIEDNLLPKTGFFQLIAADTLQIKVPANGSTYRLYAGQSPGYFPPGYNPTIAYEGCGVKTDGTFSTGFITMYSENNVLNTETTDCEEIIGSYDPNDKQATPKGYSYRHFIEVGDDLDYRIRFQNTGTDTAFTVEIRDTISEHLDMASLLPGTSSHAYELDIVNGTTLKFTFKDILLVDSTTNEPASHGFVTFKISQQPNLPLGTMIYNRAGIYFDFNEPIITNQTYHEIGEDFLPVAPTAVSLSMSLEGAYDLNTGLHATDLLDQGLLPAVQPYGAAPWEYDGTEGSGWTTSDYPSGTVDWVLIDLRETSSASSIVAKGAAILLEDGSLHPFNMVVPGNVDSVYIAVYHRNHLPILSPHRFDVSNQALSFDFRLSDSYVFGAGFGQKRIGNDWHLFVGNGAASSAGSDINVADKILWETENGYFGKYKLADYNLDGDINGIDKILWSVNNGIYTEIR